jgi:hypothetical protein
MLSMFFMGAQRSALAVQSNTDQQSVGFEKQRNPCEMVMLETTSNRSSSR